MADKEAGLIIGVEAVADKGSGKRAVEEIAKEVDSSVKGGRIEIPVDITVPIDKNKDKLTKAQKAITTEISKMTSKGFSASGKDIDTLTSKFNEFAKTFDATGKGRQNKIFREIRKQVEDLQKSYKEAQTLEKASRTHSTKTKKTTTQTPKQKEKFSQSAIDKAMNAWLKEMKTRENRKEQYKDLKLTGPRGYPSSGINAGNTNEHTFRLSESSPYGSNWAVAQARDRAKFEKKAAQELVEYVNKEMATAAPEGRRTTGVEQARFMNSAMLRDLGASVTALSNGEEGVTPEVVYQNLVATLKQWASTGKDLESTFVAITNMLEAPKSDNPKRRLGGTNGEKKTGPNEAEAKLVTKTIHAILNQVWDSPSLRDSLGFEKIFKDEMQEVTKEVKNTIKSSTSKKTGKNSQAESRKQELTNTTDTTKLVSAISNMQDDVSSEIKDSAAKTENQVRLDKIEHDAERVADSKEGKANRQLIDDVQSDAGTGMNTDANTTLLFSKLDGIFEQFTQGLGIKQNPETGETEITTELNSQPVIEVLSSILSEVTAIADKLGVKRIKESLQSNLPMAIPPEISTALTVATQNTGLPDLYRFFDEKGMWRTAGVVDHPDNRPGLKFKEDKTNYEALSESYKYQEHARKLEAEAKKKEEKTKKTMENPTVTYSKDLASAFSDSKVLGAIQKAFGVGKKQSEVDRIMSMNQTQQEELLAKRRKEFGLANTMRNTTDTGDVSQINRTGDLWRRNGDKNPNNPFRNLQITPGIEFDSKAITDALQTAIERNQFTAQTGGGFFKQLWGSMTMYAGQDSLEKSRAEAEGLNQVMAILKDAIHDLLAAINVEEMSLRGMEKSGDAVFNTDGTLNTAESSSEAITTAAKLEELKMGLTGVLAEAEMVDDVVESWGGNIKGVLQSLGFVAPELQKCNKIIKNVNAGLDKNGKALKFQKRTQEILNYSYQLMGRHIGQMFKNWMMMLNPLNGIKRLFSDFASYDTKWQRTMNVIKYNLRRIVKPMMEWIAQQLVNMIGLVNSLMKGIGSAFGQNWDLFDKDAANAEKIREELEAASNVSAGFDELHDIGGDSSNPAMDFSEDIYTPQWDGLNKILEDIGTTIGNIIKAVSDWTFWDWLILAGAALVGFTALKWLIGLFSGTTNPLQTVAKGFSFLEKAVGWAILIWAFTEFTKALTAFVECMKTAEWEDIVKTLLTLGGAFAELFLAAGGLMYLSTALGITAPAIAAIGAVVGGFALFVVALTDFIECMKTADWEDIFKSLLMLAGAFAALVLTAGGLMLIASALGMFAPQMLGLAVVIAAFAPVIAALASFVEAMKGLTSEDMLNGLLFLAGAFMAIALAIGVLLVVLSAAIASGVGALAILALAGVLAVVSLVVLALAELVRALGEAGEGIKSICEGIAEVIRAIGETISGIITAVADGIATVVQAIADGIMTVLQPIMDFMDSVIEKVVELATTIVQEIGETIRTVIETVGEVVLGIVDAIVDAIPNLLQSIVDFCNDIGPAIENSIDAIIRSITKLVNFVVSAVEYICNLVIGAINKFSVQVPDWVPGIGGTQFGFNLQKIEIPRFVPQYETGTNYVPNNGLAYLHKGEAVIPKKYNQPYQQPGLTAEEQLYMRQMINTMTSLDNTMKQGITVNGQFTQRGSDLVAVVNRTKSQTGADLLSNVAYAR